jgi:hypothetical protein
MSGVKQVNRRTLKVDIKDVDWARLAAYIDGEGKKHRQVHIWQVEARLASQILEGCLPFFIIKREQAEVCIAFQKTKVLHNCGRRGDRTPPNVIQMREQMAHEVRELKHVNYEAKEAING